MNGIRTPCPPSGFPVVFVCDERRGVSENVRMCAVVQSAIDQVQSIGTTLRERTAAERLAFTAGAVEAAARSMSAGELRPASLGWFRVIQDAIEWSRGER
jgi:hypothetical protein